VFKELRKKGEMETSVFVTQTSGKEGEGENVRGKGRNPSFDRRAKHADWGGILHKQKGERRTDESKKALNEGKVNRTFAFFKGAHMDQNRNIGGEKKGRGKGLLQGGNYTLYGQQINVGSVGQSLRVGQGLYTRKHVCRLESARCGVKILGESTRAVQRKLQK